MQKELLENVSALNALIADAAKEDGLVLRPSEKEDPFDDGAGGPMQVKRKEDPRRFLVDTILRDAHKRPVPPNDSPLPFPPPSVLSMMPNRMERRGLVDRPFEGDSSNRLAGIMGDYDERTFILYRSKTKMMASTTDVYDVGSMGGRDVDGGGRLLQAADGGNRSGQHPSVGARCVGER